MRLDARNGDNDWEVHHAEYCCMLNYVTWVDDVTCQYAQIVGIDILAGCFLFHITQAKKIAIYPAKKLIVINPVEDSDDQYLRIEKDKVPNVNSPEPVSS